MSHLVGPKGQVVIEKDIRNRLGLEPGWRTVQVLEDDHVKVYFLPPEHDESLSACLSPYIAERLATPEALADARQAAWAEAAERHKPG